MTFVYVKGMLNRRVGSFLNLFQINQAAQTGSAAIKVCLDADTQKEWKTRDRRKGACAYFMMQANRAMFGF